MGELEQRPEGTIVVLVAPTPTIAEVARAKLESFGIPVALQYQSAGRVLGLYIDGWGETRVLVPADRAAEARALLAEEPLTDLEAGADNGEGEDTPPDR